MKRTGDLASRYGGEEFACILPQTDSLGTAQIAEQIRTAVLDLKIAHPTSKVSPWLSVSVGARSMIPCVQKSLRTFVDETDQCLYMAKHGGRNQVVTG